jgi:hypothetical protein
VLVDPAFRLHLTRVGAPDVWIAGHTCGGSVCRPCSYQDRAHPNRTTLLHTVSGEDAGMIERTDIALADARTTRNLIIVQCDADILGYRAVRDP